MSEHKVISLFLSHLDTCPDVSASESYFSWTTWKRGPESAPYLMILDNKLTQDGIAVYYRMKVNE